MAGKPGLPAPRLEESAVQRREQPGLDLGEVAQLMSFRRPDVERVLGQVLSIAFRPRKAQGEPEERLVILAHKRFKLIGCIHNLLRSVVPQY